MERCQLSTSTCAKILTSYARRDYNVPDYIYTTIIPELVIVSLFCNPPITFYGLREGVRANMVVGFDPRVHTYDPSIGRLEDPERALGSLFCQINISSHVAPWALVG